MLLYFVRRGLHEPRAAYVLQTALMLFLYPRMQTGLAKSLQQAFLSLLAFYSACFSRPAALTELH
jgi:hypothetical protein